MTFVVDRTIFWTISKSYISSNYWPGNKPYFLIFNNAIGPKSGGFGGAWGDWNQAQMLIDYVRAYKVDGYGEAIQP